jgi:hypothetical protein
MRASSAFISHFVKIQTRCADRQSREQNKSNHDGYDPLPRPEGPSELNQILIVAAPGIQP